MSGDVTRELSHFCSLLGSDKIKDRKVAATGFLEQLDSARVVNAIDENSYERRKDSLTWNTIFQYVAKFVISETECLHQNQSFTYQWEKRKQDAVKCLRVFLKKADERGPRLKVQDVVGHVLKMVKEPNYNLYIGADYCKFLKNILLVPSYRCDIQAKTWRDLIDMFLKFVVDKPEWLQNSQALLTNIIYLAIDGAAALYTVRGNTLLHFFGNIFKEIWTGSYLLRVDYLLAALNSFVRSCAEDCRGQVCRLGENLFPLLLQMWKTPTMSPSFKDQLIQFLRFQVCTHHPFGAHRDEEGSWCSSVTHWKKCLQKLYEAILIDIGQLGNRVQRASSTKLDSGLPAPFFELAADVFHQVFWMQTSYYSSSTNQDTSEPGTKRQRMEQGWDSTRDKLENSSENLFLLAWLQILSTIFANHPSSIPSAEFLPFFTTLHQLLTKHKRHETITAVLRCIEDLVACCSRRRDQLNSLEADSFHSVLKQIWASALRVIGLKHLTDPAFCLLTTLLKEQVVEPDQEIWRVICGSGVPSRSSVEFIATYLRLYSLPENFQPVSSVDVFAPQKGPFTLRHYLFDWLMPVDDECEATGGISTSIWVCKNPNRFPSLPVLASVLVSLTQKFTTAFEVSGIKESVCRFQDETFQDAERCLVQMQEVYLKSSFDEKDSPWVNDGERKDSLSSGPKHNKKVETLNDLLLERLAKTAWHLCESIKFESTGLMSKERLMLFGGRLEGLIRLCSLVCQVVVFLLKNNSLSQEKVTSLPAIRKLGNILRKVANGVNEISVTHELDLSVRVEVILGVLTELESLFTMLPAKANSPEQLVKDLLREKTPSSLLDDALTIFTGKWGQCMSVNSSRLDEVERSFLNQSTSATLGDETDGFDEFESEVSSSEDNVTQSGTHSQTTKKNARIESLRTCCARFLCSWSMQDGEAAVLGNGDPQPEEIQGKVIEFLRSEDFNVSKEEDLKLYFTVASVLASSKAALPSQHLEALMSVFREAMSVHRRDQKICHQGLKLLMTLTPHLSSRTDESYTDTSLETSRQIAAHVLKAFWSLKDTQYCPAVRLQMAQCMEAFLKVDPEEKWSNMKQIKKDNAGVVKESASLSLSEQFPKLLSDSSHSVRMYMASAISVLFVRYISDDAAVPASRDSQYNSFEQVSNILVQSLSDAVGPSLSEEEREDEGVSRSSSMLACLKHIALFSPICEKRVMALLFQAVKEQFVDKELVMKVLGQLAVELGYSSRASYVESHLKFVLDNWLNHGYKITDFPCQLLDFRTIPDFFQTHHPSILANLVSRPDTVQQSIELFAKQVNPRSDCREYLAQSFCSIEAFLLPWYAVQRRTDAADTSSSGQRVKIEQARRSHEFLVNVLTNEAVDKIMTKKFDEQVVELLLRMYEPPSEGSDIAKFTKETDPEPDPPYFTSHAIKATLDYLATCFPEGKTLVSVLCTNKDTIQKILLALISNMATTHLVHEKRRILSMYRLFVLLLLKELRAGLGNTWAFFIRDVIHSLLRIIMDDKQTKKRPSQPKLHLVLDDDLFLPCCNLLYYVCKSAVECCSQEFGSHLHAIVSVLTPYAVGQDEKAEQALQLLDFLIVDESEVLSEAIRLLDPFPDTAEFKTINKRYTEIREERTSLNEEITHFLSADSGSSPLSRLEGLRHLRQTIIKNKEQLEGILNRTEDDRSAPVADLVHHLIGLGSVLSGCQGDRAKPVQCEVANCLGDIGAVDLSTVALGCTHKSDVFGLLSTKYAADPVSQRNSIIVSLLNGYLIDKNVEVVAASSSCLKKILATASGLDLLRKYEECKQEQLLWYLEPFRHSKKKRSLGHTEAMECDVREDSSDARVRDASLWIPGTDGKEYSHGQWITKLACTLIDSGCVNDEILGILSPICRTKVEFAERVFPYLVHNMLESGDDQSKTVLSEHFRGFFSHCKGSSVIQSRAGSPLPSVIQSTTSSGDTCGVKKESIRTMLAVVTYLRTQNVPKRGRVQSTLWDNNFWLDLDYLEVATAAQKCSAYFTALLYTEIWTDIQKSDPVSFNAITLPSNSQHAAMEVGTSQGSDGSLSTSYQALLLEAYSCIGEPDSVYGAGAGRLADIESRIRTYAHEQTWDKALGACDLQMQSSSSVSQTDLLQSLKNFGLDHVMRVYLKGLAAENMQATAEVSELQYESAWRNCVWDLDSSSSVGSEIPLGFHQCLYSCLCALQDEEGELFQATLDSARLKVLAEVSHVSLESVRSVYPSLSRLQCIVELENFAIRLNSPEDSVIDVWNERFPLPDNDFEFLEPVLALRTSMLQTLVKLRREKSDGPEGVLHVAHAFKDLVTHLEMQAKIARQSRNPQVAEKALFTIRQLQNAIAEVQNQLEGEDLGITWSWKMEEAKLRWARGEQDTAMYLLKSLTRHLDKARDQSTEAIGLYPQALGLYGTWLAESKSENPNTIIEDFLEKAACLMECMEGGNQASRIEAFLSLAWFADSQYQKKVDFMSSSAYENKETLMKNAKVESERLQKVCEPEKDRYTRTLNLQAQMDERELLQVVEDKRKFLQTAVEYYIKTLQAGDKYDLRMFRLCSLWFDNAREDFVSEMIKDALTKIQSRKFLPLMYQLAARLGTKSHDNRMFQGTLNEMIERTAIDHPHHTMFILLALANAEKDSKYLTKKSASSRLSRTTSKGSKGFAGEARIQTACKLIESIGKQRGKLVKDMEQLCEAYIELAYVNVTHLKNERGPFNIPDNLMITKISNLREVPVPTLDVKVDPLCRYDDIVHVVKFDSSFSLAGGVNLPKIIYCVGSDGIKRRQLVKGRDDLRQDAVMEQVFGMVNQLLMKNSETRKRKLKMRTYKVIPLSQRSGIVEWCENTVPLGEYLIGRPGSKTGAHQRYYPRDLSPFDCRKKMTGEKGTSRYEVYQEVVEHFHPVFRHFFLERFPDPAVWFERRLSYTRGVATSSIVGYVVGLGDRHVQNILVDCNTAELVHIDLGVAFEQGKFLPTPETVPFRLTRDLVDGMGLTGVEGVFRRCCEKTMDVMRTSQESLMTIVEVLLYDPLSSWTLSPEKRKALQQQAEVDINDITTCAATGDVVDSALVAETNAFEDNANKMAKRVLLRLKQKLDGVEDGVHLSVQGQVKHLVREAMDPKNLCRLFPGWQAWV